MFIKAQSAKIALHRRSSGSSPTTATWYNEIFAVTLEVITNKKITLAVAPIVGSASIMLNGLVLYKAADWDYSTMNGNEIIFSNDLELTVGDTIRAKYQA